MTTEQKLRDALADVMAQGCGQPKSCGHEFHCICPGDAARAALALPPSETICAFQGHKDAPCHQCGKSWMAPDHQAPLFDPRTPR